MLEQALTLAIDIARHAGEMLRAEFHRPGGPRGGKSHADIDEEVEAYVRGRLAEAYPDWPVTGEELDNQTGRRGKPCWAIDPQDGTADFMRGRRGTAFSLALVQEGRPVLGVVYAYAYPNDTGDLLAWAEGQPLMRNGVAVENVLQPEVTSTDILMHSAGAQRKWQPNVELSAPCRFIAMPSVAYRLALVAAGEGVLATTFNSPNGYDMAAGHALLRAAGGELCNGQGEVVRYDEHAHIVNPSGWYFGGHTAVVQQFYQRDWGRVMRAPSPPEAEGEEPRTPVRLEPGRHIADAGVLSRAQGCLLGQLAGDALGSMVEFSGPEEIARKHPGGLHELQNGGYWDTLAGQPTDDSEMALLLARALVERVGFDVERVAELYRWWIESDPFDCGGTIANAVMAASRAAPGEAAQVMRKAAQRKTSSEANGALMRVSPLGVFGWRVAPAELAAWAAAEAELTHANEVCQASSAAFCLAIAAAINSGEPSHAYTAASEWASANAPASVRQALAEARTSTSVPARENVGWVLLALQNAFYHLLNTESLKEAVVATVHAGGDTDTNAAICGALMGATHGLEVVPAQWRRMVLSCRPAEGALVVRHPRPEALWPVDALAIAECLLLQAEASVPAIKDSPVGLQRRF